ncbi:MAG: hypothetical protein KDC80_11770, partial [Saprospiraceae bacterium]|nr:hypothetical protein [Saprospiraceae bacterium]
MLKRLVSLSIVGNDRSLLYRHLGSPDCCGGRRHSDRSLRKVITSWLSAWQKVIFGSFILFLSICPDTHTNAQTYLMPSDTFSRSRFLTLAAGGTVLYGATVVGLNKAWYKGYERSSFHFFNDWGEWNNLDKTGHLFTSYFETELSYRGCRWIGINEKKSRWLA